VEEIWFENHGEVVLDSSRDLFFSTANLVGDGSLSISAGYATPAGNNWRAEWAISLADGTLLLSGESNELSRSHFTVHGGTMIVAEESPLSFSRTDPYSATAGLTVSGGLVDFQDAFEGGPVSVSSTGIIDLNGPCIATYGSFTISGGVLDVNENLNAKKLTWSGGAITPAANKSAAFTGP
jgi:hypothetical protein